MDCSGAWLIPSLSLQSEMHQEMDRRIAARLDKNTLHVLADDLIVQWYKQQSVIDQALGRVRHLEVQLALAESLPSDARVSDVHMQMAQELLAELSPTPIDRDCDGGCDEVLPSCSRG
jgi:hypothetical protein